MDVVVVLRKDLLGLLSESFACFADVLTIGSYARKSVNFASSFSPFLFPMIRKSIHCTKFSCW
jgi:hypothetical protein